MQDVAYAAETYVPGVLLESHNAWIEEAYGVRNFQDPSYAGPSVAGPIVASFFTTGEDGAVASLQDPSMGANSIVGSGYSAYTMYAPTPALEESDMPLSDQDRTAVQDIVRSELTDLKITLATHTEKFNTVNVQLVEMNKKLDGIDATKKWTIGIWITLLGIFVALVVGLHIV
ncbi:MAG: hypothetical protein ACYCYO_02220 [Bacilli bacterium]